MSAKIKGKTGIYKLYKDAVVPTTSGCSWFTFLEVWNGD